MLAMLLLALGTSAGPAVKAGKKYHIVVAAHTGGCLADGKSAGKAYPLYYLPTATTDAWTYWEINEVETGKFSIRNASTQQYITYDGERIEASKRYVGMTDALDGDNSLWQFESAGTNAWGIVCAGHPAGRLDVRAGTYLVGTYDGTGFSNIQTFSLYTEAGLQVTEASDDTAEGYSVDSWLDGTMASLDNWDTEGFFLNTNGNYYNGEANVTAPFIEKWHNAQNGGLADDYLLQHIAHAPQGKYTASADLIACYQRGQTTVTGVSFVAGTGSTAVTTNNGVPVRKTLTTQFAGGTLDMGVRLSATTANWVAIDNMHLRFLGTGEELIAGEKAKVVAELAEYYEEEVASHLTDSVAALYTDTEECFAALESLRKTVVSLPKPDPIARGLQGLTIGGHTPAYDELTETYLVSIPEATFGHDYAGTVSYDKRKGWGDLAIDGTTVTSGTTHTFSGVSATKTYTLSTTDAEGTALKRALTFTFLPVVQLYGTFSDTYAQGHIRVSEPDEPTDSLFHMKAKWRGGITNGSDKHKRNYHVKLQDDNGEKKEYKYLGLRNDNSWILESCQVDMSRCRNRTLTDLWNDFSTPPYYKASEKKARTGTRGDFVEVTLNNRYAGIYCLTEAMDRKQMRLKKQDDDGTLHGMLWKSKDWSYGVFMGHDYNSNVYPGTAPAGYNNASESWENYYVKYPDYEDNGNQTDWSVLYNAVNFVCTATDTKFKKEFGDYFDYPLLLDYYILMETTLSTDNHGKNMFFAVYDKQEDKKITFGVWDMDATLGQRWSDEYFHRTDIMNPETDYANYIAQEEHGDYNLFKRLRATNYHDFNTEVRTRYNELRQSYLATDSLLARFNRYLTRFKTSGAESREATRWNGDTDIAGHSIDFSDEYAYLTEWITKRMNYLDKTRFDIASLQTGISAANVTALSLSVINGRLTITTDRAMTLPVYTTGGTLVRTLSLSPGTTTIDDLAPGVYVADKKKIVIR